METGNILGMTRGCEVARSYMFVDALFVSACQHFTANFFKLGFLVLRTCLQPIQEERICSQLPEDAASFARTESLHAAFGSSLFFIFAEDLYC